MHRETYKKTAAQLKQLIDALRRGESPETVSQRYQEVVEKSIYRLHPPKEEKNQDLVER